MKFRKNIVITLLALYAITAQLSIALMAIAPLLTQSRTVLEWIGNGLPCTTTAWGILFFTQLIVVFIAILAVRLKRNPDPYVYPFSH